MTADLVCRALSIAIKNKRSSQGLIVHSDRGIQYCSNEYHKIIKQYKFTGSMSGKDNHYGHSPPPCTRVSVSQTLTFPRSFENLPIENFWGMLKNEIMYYQDYKKRFTAINEITQYIELEYNEGRLAKHCFAATQGKSCTRSGTRIQKDLGYRSPRQVWFDYYRQVA